MRMQSVGSALKGAALFTIGSELTKKVIDVAKKKYREHKAKTAPPTEEEVEDTENRSKLDRD